MIVGFHARIEAGAAFAIHAADQHFVLNPSSERISGQYRLVQEWQINKAPEVFAVRDLSRKHRAASNLQSRFPYVA